jgi:hypothetical protein|tara:strand:- start:211 stop:768 length:558 start_codon:yes stop_codon:yes gene_type:complete
MNKIIKDVVAKIVEIDITVTATAQRKVEVVKEVATDLAVVLGTEPTFDFWEETFSEIRGELIDNMLEQSARNWLSEVASQLKKEFDLVKPAKATVASKAMSEQRAKVEELSHKGIDELDEMMKVYDTDTQAIIVKAKQKKQKDAEKEDKKASTAYKKNLKDEIKTFMKDSDTEQLVALVGFIRTL